MTGKTEIVYYCKTVIGGKKIEIESKRKHVLAFYKGYLDQYERPDFTVSASQEEIRQEIKDNYAALLTETEETDGIAIESINAETNVIYRKIADYMLGFQTILMHGAAISVNNKCYMFIAPSGTGKTTHIKNWLKSIPDTFVVNGDKPLINVETKMVYGTPWSGKEGMNKNTFVPLAGIINLERGLENSISPVSFKEMLPYLMQQTYMPASAADRILVYKHLGELKDIPFYQLKCNMDAESAITAYRGIKEYERKKDD